MKRQSSSIFGISLCLFLIHQQAFSMDGKENAEPNVLPAILTKQQIVEAYLATKLDQSALATYEKEEVKPTITYPGTMLDAYLKANRAAEAILRHGTVREEIAPMVFRAIKNLGVPPDPFLVFSLLNALNDRLTPRAEDRVKSAFTLMARMVMNAPHMLLTENREKRNFESFTFFSHCAQYCGYLLIHTAEGWEGRLIDFWQIYFNEEAYPAVASWLMPLYDFYVRESYYFQEVNDPFSVDEWPKLRQKISTPDRFYDDDWLNSCGVDASVFDSPYDYFEKLSDYLIKDVDIYWTLLPKLALTDPGLQMEFVTVMLAAGADPYTIIDSNGNRPIELSRKVGLHRGAALLINGTNDEAEKTAPRMLKKRPFAVERTPLARIENIPTKRQKRPDQPPSCARVGQKKKAPPPKQSISLYCDETL